ncbi:MAG TPA: hypothetical protein PL182_00445 [Pseudobdellovibrionaceae bacterium]|nr:hypothetical protein [Pseudobdellovibrionaceae bacterium]
MMKMIIFLFTILTSMTVAAENSYFCGGFNEGPFVVIHLDTQVACYGEWDREIGCTAYDTALDIVSHKKGTEVIQGKPYGYQEFYLKAPELIEGLVGDQKIRIYDTPVEENLFRADLDGYFFTRPLTRLPSDPDLFEQEGELMGVCTRFQFPWR